MTTIHDRDSGASADRFPRGVRLGRGTLLFLGFIAACGPLEPGEEPSESEIEIASDPGGYTTKITNGTKTTAYPSVGYLTNGGTSCSATLIGPREVLTAAHCIDGSSGRFLVGGSDRRWSKAYVHEKYDDDTLDNDLAVVILDEAVSGIQPSPLGTTPLTKGQQIALVGYGYTSFKGGNPANEKYVGFNRIAQVAAEWFSYVGNSNNCSGDSGGPTFIGDALVGVHSSGIGNRYCSKTGYDVRVDPYVSWIKSKTADGGGVGGDGDGDGDRGDTPCADTPGFIDAKRYRCEDWQGYDCSVAKERWRYSQAQEDRIVENCRASCGLCGP